MKSRTQRLALSALLGFGMLGGVLLATGPAFAQGEYGDPPDLLEPNLALPPEKRVYRRIPAPGWYGPGYYGPGVGIYVDPIAPRYYRPRTYAPRTYERRASDPHVEWCYGQYRSYREWDNSWQPNRGPRRECISPYY